MLILTPSPGLRVSESDLWIYKTVLLWLCIDLLRNLTKKQLADKRAYIYIKDNGARHNVLGTRAFGSIGSETVKPTIDIAGRPLRRTWTLLSKSLQPWDQSMKVIHDPRMMGWRVGDRIQVAPTKGGSQGEAQTFTITKFGAFNRIWLMFATVVQYRLRWC